VKDRTYTVNDRFKKLEFVHRLDTYSKVQRWSPCNDSMDLWQGHADLGKVLKYNLLPSNFTVC